MRLVPHLPARIDRFALRTLRRSGNHRRPTPPPSRRWRRRHRSKHAGFEIFYVPEVSGWQYRAPDSTTSALSYRSVFLARKAVDEVADGAKAPRAAKQAS